MPRPLTALAILACWCLVPCVPAMAAHVTAERNDRGVVIKIDGKPFTEYLTRSGAKPILWPVVGPTGKRMTRNYPMESGQVPGEKHDHIHHRSIWLTHGSVNGVDFWGENPGHGNIVHRQFVKVQSGQDHAVVVTRNDWLSPDGKKVCEDVRDLRFGGDQNQRWIDVNVTIKATNGPVKFGDTKEGTFGIRVAGTMKVDLGHGRIINSRGDTNKQAWGKRASWVDYQGPVQGEMLGIAVLNHPSSFRYPTYWHVRTYGLFAANPFGLHNFLHLAKPRGEYTLEPGKTLTLRYRVVFHKGDEKTAKIADQFAAYARTRPEED